MRKDQKAKCFPPSKKFQVRGKLIDMEARLIRSWMAGAPASYLCYSYIKNFKSKTSSWTLFSKGLIKKW